MIKTRKNNATLRGKALGSKSLSIKKRRKAIINDELVTPSVVSIVAGGNNDEKKPVAGNFDDTMAYVRIEEAGQHNFYYDETLYPSWSDIVWDAFYGQFEISVDVRPASDPRVEYPLHSGVYYYPAYDVSY
jgi:hypothetical protein